MSVLTCFHLLCLLTPEEQSWTIPPKFPIEEAGTAPSSGVLPHIAFSNLLS